VLGLAVKHTLILNIRLTYTALQSYGGDEYRPKQAQEQPSRGSQDKRWYLIYFQYR
jgi:hypothetical protein